MLGSDAYTDECQVQTPIWIPNLRCRPICTWKQRSEERGKLRSGKSLFKYSIQQIYGPKQLLFFFFFSLCKIKTTTGFPVHIYHMLFPTSFKIISVTILQNFWASAISTGIIYFANQAVVKNYFFNRKSDFIYLLLQYHYDPWKHCTQWNLWVTAWNTINSLKWQMHLVHCNRLYTSGQDACKTKSHKLPVCALQDLLGTIFI